MVVVCMLHLGVGCCLSKHFAYGNLIAIKINKVHNTNVKIFFTILLQFLYSCYLSVINHFKLIQVAKIKSSENQKSGKFWKRLAQTSFKPGQKATGKVSTSSTGWTGRNKFSRQGKWIPGNSKGKIRATSNITSNGVPLSTSYCQ